MRISIFIAVLLACTAVTATSQGKPNILVIWGDDIGWSNLGAYNHGVMGYPTQTSTP